MLVYFCEIQTVKWTFFKPNHRWQNFFNSVKTIAGKRCCIKKFIMLPSWHGKHSLLYLLRKSFCLCCLNCNGPTKKPYCFTLHVYVCPNRSWEMGQMLLYIDSANDSLWTKKAFSLSLSPTVPILQNFFSPILGEKLPIFGVHRHPLY